MTWWRGAGSNLHAYLSYGAAASIMTGLIEGERRARSMPRVVAASSRQALVSLAYRTLATVAAPPREGGSVCLVEQAAAGKTEA